MFKFDFQVDEIEEEKSAVKENADKDINSTCDTIIDWYDSEEIFPPNELPDNLDVLKLNSLKKDFKDVSLAYMVSGFVLDDIRDNEQKDLDIKKAEEQHTDLIPGVYEGGAKIWECTDDLLLYLSENYPTDKWSKLNVLDLGCGSGLLGIYAFCGGAQVTFHDYNKDVLEKITIPNVLLNTSLPSEGSDEVYDYDKLKDNARFFSGDWSKWSNLTNNGGQYDMILTSETIYNTQNQMKLLDCVHDKLKPDGIVLLAAKTYYFGVGGSLRYFEELMDKDTRFSYKVVWTSTEGVKREILEIKKKIKT